MNILHAQKRFLRELRANMEHLPLEVCRIFLNCFDTQTFNLYFTAIRTYDAKEQALGTFYLKSRTFQKRVKEFQKVAEPSPFTVSLDWYRFLPKGRFPRYKFLIIDLVGSLPDALQEEAQECLTEIEKFNQIINEYLREQHPDLQ